MKTDPIVLLLINITDTDKILIAYPLTMVLGSKLISSRLAGYREGVDHPRMRNLLLEDVALAKKHEKEILLVIHKYPDATFAEGIATHVVDFSHRDEKTVPEAQLSFSGELNGNEKMVVDQIVEFIGF